MKKRILLPTDFSKNSWNTIKYARELYKKEACDFFLLNAFSTNNYVLGSMMDPEPGEPLFEEAKNRSVLEMEKLLKRIAILEDYPLHSYYTHTVYNEPLEAIKNFVETKDIELIFIGNKGETDDVNIIYGSNTIDIMEKVRNCPVFVIPSHSIFKEPNEIVFPTSYRTHYKRRELQQLYEVAKITNAPVRILHISKDKLSEEQKENQKLLENCLDGLSYTYHTLDQIDVQTGLHAFVQSRESEMIVFINKKHLFFDTMFSRPMVKQLGKNAPVPVLVLHDLRN